MFRVHDEVRSIVQGLWEEGGLELFGPRLVCFVKRVKSYGWRGLGSELRSTRNCTLAKGYNSCRPSSQAVSIRWPMAEKPSRWRIP